MDKKDKIIKEVEAYYSSRIKEHGATPKGVDWNSEESQHLRFKQLLKIISEEEVNFSILDYGCGFGSMYSFMKANYSSFDFHGFDISSEMISEAKRLHPLATWTTALEEHSFDFVVASGIFNVRLKNKDEDWKKYILETLQTMNRISKKGFSFNILTSYSDKEYMRDYLFYADPAFFFDYCKKEFSLKVALLHDYPLYEFSILVRK